VLTRESQLPLSQAWTSGGIYAPTIRYHNGRFYMITTNCGGGGNFYVWTDDIRGEWSDPVWIDHDGIDPSLFWDDDGKVYYIGSGMRQFEIDLETGEKLSEVKQVWTGTGGRCPEGPHMYKKDGWYYLLIAEGGTEYGHMQTIARSRSVWGPFESCPRNPILSHRDDICSPFQAVGHADIVEDPQGNWWMVFHAIRPTNAQLHHIGRETMLAPFTWDDEGWPLISPVKEIMTGPGEGKAIAQSEWRDDFSGEDFDPLWSWLRNPHMGNYRLGGDGLTLLGCAHTLNDLRSPTFLGLRQQLFDLRCETRMTLTGEEGTAGLTVFHTAEHHYDLCVKRAGSGCEVRLRRRAADMKVISAPVVFADTDTLVLRFEADKNLYTFLAGPDEEKLLPVGTGRTQLLSTEAMPCTFTGCFNGLFAEGAVQARFHYFSVKAH
jgi:alpha-N-arabinofuranosidase